jgi:signal transduction histidine kinase
VGTGIVKDAVGPRRAEVLRERLDSAADVARAAVDIRELARALSFGDTASIELVTLVAELGSVAAPGAEMIACPVLDGGSRGIDLHIVDPAPGALDRWVVAPATNGVPRGLAFAQALAHDVGVHVDDDRGAVAHARLWAGVEIGEAGDRGAVDIGALALPVDGPNAPRSAWAADAQGDAERLILVEGEGTGALAAEAAAGAIHRFAQSPGHPPRATIEAIDDELRDTRGATVAVAAIDARAGELRFAAAGRMTAVLLAGGESRVLDLTDRLAGTPGGPPEETVLPWTADARLMLFSKPLPFDPERADRAGLLATSPRLAAGVAYRDFALGAKDLTLLVAHPREARHAPVSRHVAALGIGEVDDVSLAARLARAVADTLRLDRDVQLALAISVAQLADGALERTGGTGMRCAVRERAGERTLVLTLGDRRGLTPCTLEIDGLPGEAAYIPAVGDTGVVLVSVPVPSGDGPLSTDVLDDLGRRVAPLRSPSADAAELQRANRRLTQALAELNGRHRDVVRLARELEDTNRAVTGLSAELETQAVDLRHANDRQRRLVSTIAHEVRTPVYAIQGLLEDLLEVQGATLSEALRADLRMIDGATHELLQIVNDQLELLKLEAETPVLRPDEIDVEELFSSLRGMLGGLRSPAEVELTFDADPDLEPLWTDPQRLGQILRNLISNALKFTDRGTVAVRARRVAEGRVAFDVTDTGPGIAREDLERVFEEYAQVTGGRGSPMPGTGLGLPISRHLAAALGGTLTVTSEPDQGSTFALTIPTRL